MAKATKAKSPHIALTQLLLNEKLCQDMLPGFVSLIKFVSIDASNFLNPPLVIPLISEALFILNKVYEGFKNMKITNKSNNALSKNYKTLTHVGESLAEVILEKTIALFLIGDDCFKDRVNLTYP